MKLFGIVYKHTNKLNGKIYIGQTIQVKNPNRRFRKDSTTYRSYMGSTAFHKALQKYTWDGFETEIVYSAFDQESLNKAEEYFIKFYDCALPKGYNSVTIVDGNIEYTQEVRKKISDSRKEYYANLEEKPVAPNKKEHSMINGAAHKNCPYCKTDKTLEFFGKNKSRWDGLNTYCKACNIAKDNRVYVGKSEEELQEVYKKRGEKMKISVKNYFDNNPQRKAIISQQRSKALIATHIETGKEVEFSSATEARKFGFDNTNIGKAMKNNLPYKKHTWRFK